MVSIADQVKWEKDMTSLGVSRFREQEREAKLKSRFTDTSAGSRLLKVYLSQVSARISERVSTPGRKSMYIKLIKGVDPDKMAFFVLNKVIQCIYKPASIQKVAADVGSMIEDELRFSKFEIALPEYYNAIQRDLDRRNAVNYRHRHRVLVSTMNDKKVIWHPWTNETHIGVGMQLLACAEEASDLIVRKKEKGALKFCPSDEVLEWINTHDTSIEVMFPDRMPCIIPPRNWESWIKGGFYSNRLAKLTSLVKTRSGQQRDTQGPLLTSANMPDVLNSINALQQTSWKINTKILRVVQEVWERNLQLGMPPSEPYEIPSAPDIGDRKPRDLEGAEKDKFDEWKAEARTLHTLETQRESELLSIVRAMRLASKMESIDTMWLVYQMDFRGRTYSTTNGVSPQGADISKALVHFGKAEPLTKRGWYWFKVHGANKYGFDKGSYDDRVEWVHNREQSIIQAGQDPIGCADVWKDADKPYQFLAWCIEYSEAMRHPTGPWEYLSHLPVALDGSCNGLQHFSAMLRDEVGGNSVNLVPNNKPADIYQDVADVCTRKLQEIVQQPEHEHYIMAANWLALFNKLSNGKMTRKLSKKPVMTLPYGSTLQTCTKTVHEWYLDQKIDFFPVNTGFKHSVFLAKVLWESIGEVVIAARAAMKWLQKCARVSAKYDKPIIYETPLGFPMVQFSPQYDTAHIETQIGGRFRLQLKKEIPGVSMYKAASGSSPNLIHSIDATHMHMVVNKAVKKGMTHFAMIHDDFGVHARFIPEFHKIIRETFVDLHSNTDVLKDFKEQQEKRTGIDLPDLPDKGKLDLNEVLNSDYFFG